MPQQAEQDSRRCGEARRSRVCIITLYLSESLGARHLSSMLKARGHDCALIFFKQFRWGEFHPVTKREEELLLALLRRLRPDLVGISMTSSLVADLAFGLADTIQEQLRAPVILGGGHASVSPEECIQHAGYVCVGEGEMAVAQLADALASGQPTSGIPSIWARIGDEVHRNELSPLVQDLDSLPFPTYGDPASYLIEDDALEEVDPATRIPMYHTAASRMNCPFNCAFCAGVWFRRTLYAGKGQVRRYRSVGNLLAEIQGAVARHPGIELVQFWDEVFGAGAPKGWFDEFCERFPGEIGRPFGIWTHPGLITKEYAGKLRAAGLKSVVIGVQSGSERVRREVLNRHESNATVLRAARILRDHGVAAVYDFILDLPWLAEENCRETFELVMRLPRPVSVGLHSLIFLPHTALTERALREGAIRPEQVALRDKALSERFESFLWKYRLEMRDRRAAFWHSLIYLASMPFMPRRLLRLVSRMRLLLQLYPQPLMAAAQVARLRSQSGQVKLFPAVEAVWPCLAGFLARHPTLGRLVNRSARALGRIALRGLKDGGPSPGVRAKRV